MKILKYLSDNLVGSDLRRPSLVGRPWVKVKSCPITHLSAPACCRMYYTGRYRWKILFWRE